jgi:hypothetical protein
MKYIVNIALFCLILSSCTSNTEKTKILNYTISEKEDISYLNTPRMVYRIILNVDSIPTETDMKNTAISIWENGNKNWKEFTTFLYLPEMNTGMMAFGVGEFNPNGLVKFEKNEVSLYGTKWEIKKPKKVEKEIPTTELKEYFMDLSTVNLSARKIKINIKTNFPDGTNFLVTVGRTHFLKGTDDKYSGEIFDNDFSVNQGKIETTVDVNDSDWYNEHQRLVKALPDDIKPISKISDNISVSVLFSPKREQPNTILKILGNNGEYVSGKGAEKKYGFTTYRVSKEINIPFKK